jgi:hypothetical protein
VSCPDADATSAALDAAAAGPKRVATDGMEVEQQPLKDLIEADRYARSRCATRKPHRGLRFTRLVPPGTT